MGKLERKYERELAVIGVQSPKYPAEGDPQNLLRAVERHGLRHSVVDDPDHRIWDSYAVNAWPTLVFISPDGQVIGRHAGEVPFEDLDRVMAELIAEYERTGSLSRRPLDLGIRPFARAADQLSFPGKVLATAEGLFIADSGHNRVVIADLDGSVRQVVGGGGAGLEDGDFASARFHRPQGLALDAYRGVLYVADAENHAIRAVDLRAGEVRTVAGTGEQARRVVRSGPARSTPLSSPWDLALLEGTLYIAMAGLHQVWSLDLASEMVGVWAGTGHEGIRDSARQTAWLAQPMGLSLQGRELYVSCAESQAVRRIDLETGSVTTLAGEGLFVFGDEDGPAASARLQHNQAVAASYEGLYIADTYNNKIKRLDLSTGEVRTCAGSGRRGDLDGPGENARFDEPAGLSIHEGTLYVADTNNHLIRAVDLESGHVRTLQLRGWEAASSSGVGT